MKVLSEQRERSGGLEFTYKVNAKMRRAAISCRVARRGGASDVKATQSPSRELKIPNSSKVL